MIRVPSRIALPLLVTAVLFAGTLPVQAGSLHWESDYGKAKAQAIEESKPILAMFTATWCGPCRKMKSSTLSDATVERELAEHFVPLMVDVDRDRATSRKFGITAMPTIMVIDPSTERGETVRGFQSRSQFLSFLSRNKQDIQLASGTKQVPAKMEQTAASSLKAEKISAAELKSSGVEMLSTNCLVTVVKEGKLAEGKPEFAARVGDLAAQFSSRQQLDEFLAAPAKFWPELQGNCPVSFKDSGKTVRGEARWAVEYDDQLFFCHSREHALKFIENPSSYITEEVRVGLGATKEKVVR
ncbi:MAG: thioredoxin fold domain-containing protein [Rubinisphaera brasiliensis]|uniref:Thioredoxin domain-containing protein n=1 Tax=Rubinisphaera brasiliensis (strain ATCC 49424 / DSM 5305 / JCM 21570 / IAM 15109 / NBRC 103401 / IFAM 1448) TaxID=756272 RepID=F0SGJ7_RUBBR|nr:thioredoxin family protein [Rubinisphaera brasiliensis]ADY61602.1 Thioredoxin domain-containing protein [Rubinisphaera brasiliensis DSM 5305]MBB03474.1 hypothetical protein [Planctomyces sp.]